MGNPLQPALEATAAATEEDLARFPAFEPSGTLWIGGVGQSEAPARLLATLWSHRRGPALWIPPGGWAGLQDGFEAQVLGISHSLSPHGRLPLEAARRAERPAWSLTARPERTGGAIPLTLSEQTETGPLRIQATAAQTLAVWGLAGERSLWARARQGLALVNPPPAGLQPPVAFVTSGACPGIDAAVASLRWAAWEGYGLPVHGFDVLSLAHGPLSVLAAGFGQLWAFGREPSSWMDRLEAALEGRLELVRFHVAPDPVAAWFQAYGEGLLMLARLGPRPRAPVDDRHLYGWEALDPGLR